MKTDIARHNVQSREATEELVPKESKSLMETDFIQDEINHLLNETSRLSRLDAYLINTEQLIENASNCVSAIGVLLKGAKQLLRKACESQDDVLWSNFTITFNEFLSQVEMIIDEAGPPGQNLLRGDHIKIALSHENSGFLVKGSDLSPPGLGFETYPVEALYEEQKVIILFGKLEAARKFLCGVEAGFEGALTVIQSRKQLVEGQLERLHIKIQAKKNLRFARHIEQVQNQQSPSLTEMIENLRSNGNNGNYDANPNFSSVNPNENAQLEYQSETPSTEEVFQRVISEHVTSNHVEPNNPISFQNYQLSSDNISDDIMETARLAQAPRPRVEEKKRETGISSILNLFRSEKQEVDDGIRTILDRLKRKRVDDIENDLFVPDNQYQNSLNSLCIQLLRYLDPDSINNLSTQFENGELEAYAVYLSQLVSENNKLHEGVVSEAGFKSVLQEFEKTFQQMVKEQHMLAPGNVEAHVNSWLESSYGIIYKVIFKTLRQPSIAPMRGLQESIPQ